MKIILAAVACLALLLPLPSFAQDKPLPVSEILKKTDVSQHTSAEIKEYGRQVKGKQAAGRGQVVDVLEGRREGYRVTIMLDGTKNAKGYNVVLYTGQNASAELKKNDRVKFSGEVGRISTFRGTSVDIHGTYEKTK
ncbi:MAG: hypothetical protein OHK006_02930 [Thermodesulfovibrionales bacterium]